MSTPQMWSALPENPFAVARVVEINAEKSSTARISTSFTVGGNSCT
ncbi:hypothetical protein H6G81_23535 [Scytonema hofmannii FACHB-248]|uniref:Uncharacterized protein n=1 Tax=Scytonema hofmannii FACHB-248 TaxID=1842502 RepID=A0ABR8GWT0_9CYAN|nr:MULTISPECIES: hypothetical protein [Nostocales]MBD2607416.1 hypothetical protein [Scytonema hofmannii FACHB-248]